MQYSTMKITENKEHKMQDKGRYSYIIVGAGAAGCVVANRLSADPKNSVLLLEAGGKDWNPLIHVPIGLLVET